MGIGECSEFARKPNTPLLDHWMMNDHRTALRPINAAARTRPTTSSRSRADISLGAAMTISPVLVVVVRAAQVWTDT